MASNPIAVGLNDLGPIGHGSEHIDLAAVEADGEPLFHREDEMNFFRGVKSRNIVISIGGIKLQQRIVEDIAEQAG